MYLTSHSGLRYSSIPYGLLVAKELERIPAYFLSNGGVPGTPVDKGKWSLDRGCRQRRAGRLFSSQSRIVVVGNRKLPAPTAVSTMSLTVVSLMAASVLLAPELKHQGEEHKASDRATLGSSLRQPGFDRLIPRADISPAWNRPSVP